MAKNTVPEAKEALNRFKMEAASELGRNRLFVEPCGLCFVNKFERGFSRPLLHFKRDL